MAVVDEREQLLEKEIDMLRTVQLSTPTDEMKVYKDMVLFGVVPMLQRSKEVRCPVPNGQGTTILGSTRTSDSKTTDVAATTVSIIIDPATMIAKYGRPGISVEEQNSAGTVKSYSITHGDDPTIIDASVVVGYAIRVTPTGSFFETGGTLKGAVLPRRRGAKSFHDVTYARISELAVDKPRCTREMLNRQIQGTPLPPALTMILPIKNPLLARPLPVGINGSIIRSQRSDEFWESVAPRSVDLVTGSGWNGATPNILTVLAEVDGNEAACFYTAAYTGSENPIKADVSDLDVTIEGQVGFDIADVTTVSDLSVFFTIRAYGSLGTVIAVSSDYYIDISLPSLGAFHNQVSFDATLNVKTGGDRITNVDVLMSASTTAGSVDMTLINGTVSIEDSLPLSYSFDDAIGVFKMRGIGSMEFEVDLTALNVTQYSAALRTATGGESPQFVGESDMATLVGIMNSHAYRVLTAEENAVQEAKLGLEWAQAMSADAMLAKAKDFVEPMVNPAFEAVDTLIKYADTLEPFLAVVPGGGEAIIALEEARRMRDVAGRLRRGQGKSGTSQSIYDMAFARRGRSSGGGSVKFPVIYSDILGRPTQSPQLSTLSVEFEPKGVVQLTNISGMSKHMQKFISQLPFGVSITSSLPTIGQSWEAAAVHAITSSETSSPVTGVLLDVSDDRVMFGAPMGVKEKLSAFPDLHVATGMMRLPL